MSTLPATAPQPADRETNSSPRNFGELWTEALRRYKTETGNDLLELPAAKAFPTNPGSTEEVMKHFKEQNEAFEAFRSRGKRILGVLKPIVDVVLLIKDCAEDASVSPDARVQGNCLTD